MDKKIEEFRIIAEERWYYLENRDSKKANKCFDRLTKLVVLLREEDKLEQLAVLLEDANDGVKFEAASKLLSLYPKESEQVLEYVANKRGILPFAAKQTIQQWKAGNINNR